MKVCIYKEDSEVTRLVYILETICAYNVGKPPMMRCCQNPAMTNGYCQNHGGQNFQDNTYDWHCFLMSIRQKCNHSTGEFTKAAATVKVEDYFRLGNRPLETGDYIRVADRVFIVRTRGFVELSKDKGFNMRPFEHVEEANLAQQDALKRDFLLSVAVALKMSVEEFKEFLRKQPMALPESYRQLTP